jgi:hypothetical protein
MNIRINGNTITEADVIEINIDDVWVRVERISTDDPRLRLSVVDSIGCGLAIIPRQFETVDIAIEPAL